MPTTTAIRKFLESVRTGETDTTKALDELFKNVAGRRRALMAHADMAHLRKAHSLDRSPPSGVSAGWWRAHLSTLQPLELTHLDDWPEKLKENVRGKLVHAIDNGRPIKFVWELCDGNAEQTDIKDPGPPQRITVTFRSPRSKMTVTANSVTVTV
jgi:hypothetical protein